jgi:hypothetical protein
MNTKGILTFLSDWKVAIVTSCVILLLTMLIFFITGSGQSHIDQKKSQQISQAKGFLLSVIGPRIKNVDESFSFIIAFLLAFIPATQKNRFRSTQYIHRRPTLTLALRLVYTQTTASSL